VHEHAQRMLSGLLRVPVEQLDLDSQLPDNLPAESEIEDFKSRYSLIVEMGRREKLTIRQIIGRLGGGRGISRSPAHPNRSPTRSKSGLRTGPPTDSISCRHCCRPVSNCSSSTWCRFSVLAGSFATSTPDGPCEITTVCRDRSTSTAAIQRKCRDMSRSFEFELGDTQRAGPRPFDGRASTKHQWFYDKPPRTSECCREKAQQIAGPKLRGAYA